MSIFVLGSYVNAHCLSVEHLPIAGESLGAQSLWTEHGGKGLNIAIGLHRLGSAVNLLLAVGNDSAGEAVIHFLRTEGIDTRWVLKVDDRSGFGIGLVEPNGGNVIAVYPGANALLDTISVQMALDALSSAQLVCAQFEVPEAAILEAFQQARVRGIKTFLNPSPWRMPSAALLAVTDILVVNEVEAAGLFGLDASQSRKMPQDWLSLLPTLVWHGDLLVITLAEQGCVALQAKRPAIHVPAWIITRVDSTGAGDAFAAGLVRAWQQGWELVDALRFANACGAMTAAQQGVIPILPTEAAVMAFMGSFSM